jgi:hypothetical protein
MSHDYTFRFWRIRADMVEALEAYVQDGIPLGDFLQAVICNDFKAAAGRADDDNLMNLPAFAAYMVNEMPMMSHGSREHYTVWLARKRIEHNMAGIAADATMLAAGARPSTGEENDL